MFYCALHTVHTVHSLRLSKYTSLSLVQGDHYSQLLENERRMVVGLRSSLAAKERELTETVDRVLQEKVALAKVQGELQALRARCQTDQQHISSLQSKVSCDLYLIVTYCLCGCDFIGVHQRSVPQPSNVTVFQFQEETILAGIFYVLQT